MFNFIRLAGRRTIKLVEYLGLFTLMLGSIVKQLPYLFRQFYLTVDQMMKIGVNSMTLVSVTSVFTGMVAAVQAAYQVEGMGPPNFIGMVVGKSIIIELGPVLTGLVIAGRVGAAIAAEIGTMRVTEQIDAMETMALDPMRYLVMPRFVAGLLMLPTLTVYACFVAIVGGWFTAINVAPISTHTYFSGMQGFVTSLDIFAGFFKSVIFGGIITSIGCFYGYHTSGGAEGVGKSTMGAVVASSVMILISDYLVAALVF
ncbi:MAG: ABC transporter permease [Gemmatimonadetes bacterium]|nr:MAG: ABC transporter permease [Gemmatimonadota bacterium]